jgi:hypothetical protein
MAPVTENLLHAIHLRARTASPRSHAFHSLRLHLHIVTQTSICSAFRRREHSKHPARPASEERASQIQRHRPARQQSHWKSSQHRDHQTYGLWDPSLLLTALDPSLAMQYRPAGWRQKRVRAATLWRVSKLSASFKRLSRCRPCNTGGDFRTYVACRR